MRVLVIGEVVVDVGFAIDKLCGGGPFSMFSGNAAVVHPVHHVAALPGVVAASTFL